MANPNNVALVTTDGLEQAWLDKCPGCGATVSAIKHDFSLCSQLQNALYRIRQLELARSDDTATGDTLDPLADQEAAAELVEEAEAAVRGRAIGD